ncbi:MAG: hypothetical protein GX099_04255, partial [Clostridiaceae bacterium]|nr:hypothetical protein [Clostridiaceae bacterium]
MLRGRNGDDKERDESLMPDRLIHFEPEEQSDGPEDESGSVFGTYYKTIASEPTASESILFSSDAPEDDEANEVTPDQIAPEYSPVVYQDEITDSKETVDASFPLFLSFKASDSAKSVSEVLRDKSSRNDYPDPDNLTEISEDSAFDNDSVTVESISSEAGHTGPDVASNKYTEPEVMNETPFNHNELSDYDPFDIALEDLNVPVFKPLQNTGPADHTDSYDIPEVFGSRPEESIPDRELQSEDILHPETKQYDNQYDDTEPNTNDIDLNESAGMTAFVPLFGDEIASPSEAQAEPILEESPGEVNKAQDMNVGVESAYPIDQELPASTEEEQTEELIESETTEPVDPDQTEEPIAPAD